tara:strand:+ start:296 stop:565 length:270 start_codon:yes stop_codon:yes gene_type:complete
MEKQKLILEKNENLEITLYDGTKVRINQSELKINTISIVHHETRSMDEIKLTNFSFAHKGKHAWTDCTSKIKNKLTNITTFVEHTAFNR